MCGKALSLESCTKARRDHVPTRAAGQHRVPAAPATCGAAQLRDCGGSLGNPLLARHRGHGRAQPHPGAGNALGFAFSRVRKILQPVPAAETSWDECLEAPHIPTLSCGPGAGGSGGMRSGDAVRGCGRAGAQPWKRAEHPPLPRQRRAIPHPAAPAVAWPGPPGSAGEQLTPERRLLSPHPPRLLL